MENQNLYIGIDPGVNTGIAIWNANIGDWELIKTVNIIDAMEIIIQFNNKDRIVEVIVEDARMVKYKTDPVKAQGAGSIKRDCSVWETFLIHYQIPHKFLRPKKAITKINSKLFKMMTKYQGQTSNHARDAAMLVFKRDSK